MDLIDKSVRSKRDMSALTKALKNIRRKESCPIPVVFSEESVFFEDMHFFWKKGLKLKYIACIFDDFASSIRLEGKSPPSVSSKVVAKYSYGENQYSIAGKKDLYAHIIDTSKYVFELDGYSDEEKRGSALLALIHDIGKFKYIRTHYKISSSLSHESASAEYARKIITDREDQQMLHLFSDWLDKKEGREFPNNTYGKILNIADVADRRGERK